MFWNGSAAMEGLWAKIEGQAELIALQTRSFTNKWAHPAIKLKITASPHSDRPLKGRRRTNATPKCQDAINKQIAKMIRSPCPRLAFVAIASIIAKRSAAPSLAKNRSAKDTTEGSMFGVRHQPPLPAVDVGQRHGLLLPV
jgi:hypothetical protein